MKTRHVAALVAALSLAASVSCASSAPEARANDATRRSDKPASGSDGGTTLDVFRKDQKAVETARACLEREVGKPARREGEPLAALVAALVRKCLGPRGSEALWNQAGALPFTVAVHGRTSEEVRLKYFCSDVCPQYGNVLAILADVPADKCCKLGQVPLRDAAWGGYLGCSPAELASENEKRNARCGKGTGDPPPGR